MSSNGLGRSGSGQDAYGWGVPVGAAAPRYPGEVFKTPLMPGDPGPAIPTDPATGAPLEKGLRDVVRDGIKEALCAENAGCVVEVQPSQLVHPGFRGVIRVIENRRILFNADSVNAVLAAINLGAAEMGADAVFIGPDTGVAAFRIVPGGWSGRILTVDINVENGDGSKVNGRVEVEGGSIIVADRPLTSKGLRADLRDNAYALIPEKSTAKVVVTLNATDRLSPYIVNTRLVMIEWNPRLARGDTLMGVNY